MPATVLNMKCMSITGNGNYVSLVKLKLEITSSELIFGGFLPFETTVRSCQLARTKTKREIFPMKL
jgi:hypothetical protein